jgi:succinate dehydrogenase / fumarate reductase flavoprotein subunit
MNNKHRTKISNVLVIGSGGAGLRAAIAAHEAGAQVLIVGKRHRKDAHTVLAAGGINAAFANVDPEDSWQQHFADTYLEGYHLADARAVEILVQEAPAAVEDLVDWGCDFARTTDGRLDQRFFGAHTYRRTCYAGDYTGRAILHTLVDKVDELGIEIDEFQYVSRLLVNDGRCFGAMAFNIHSGQRTVYLADAVILAAGGHTRIWRMSSSRRDENTGDAMYLALKAGCELVDMELVQFHPTGMVAPESLAGTLVTEAVRGEGGRLFNSDGDRYMARYDPERKELSTRDRVALANYSEIMAGRGGPNGGVFLDISHRSKKHILEKLPRMYRQFMETQMLDISRQSMEVAPTAHYSMGGVAVEAETQASNVQGLYAVGECTGGVHGANRLGGNSLAEILVFGKRAGRAAAVYSSELDAQVRDRAAVEAAHADLDSLIKEGNELARPLQRAIRDVMWEGCGVIKNGDKMLAGLARLAEIRQAAGDVDVRPNSEGFIDLALALDLRGSLYAAEATLRSAVERQESRGCHQRSDYPDLSPALEINIRVKLGPDGRLLTHQRPAAPIPEGLSRYLDQTQEVEVAGRLLE